MNALPLLLLLAVSPAARGPSASHAKVPHERADAWAPAAAAVHRWPDGLTLVVQGVPRATTSSLRMVVRAGGALDPPGKAGVAHLLEHVLVQQGDAGPAMFREVRAAGGELNAHTSRSWTTFELDAPAGRFPALAERYLRLVTGPTWDAVDLRTERAVVDRESALRGEEEASMLDAALFPAPVQTGPLIGSEQSRKGLTLEDAQGFFLAQYLPGRTTLIMTGAITLDEAVALVDRAYLVPPLPASTIAPPEPLSLPVVQSVPSLLTASAQGYVLDPRDRDVCGDLAAVLELRLVLAVREGGPHVSEVGASCVQLRGHDLLVAFAYTSTLDAPELPADIGAVFAGLARSPPGAQELARAERRRMRQRDRIGADPVQLAVTLAMHVAHLGAEHLEEALPGTVHPPARLREAAGRLVPDRRFQLDFGLHD